MKNRAFFYRALLITSLLSNVVLAFLLLVRVKGSLVGLCFDENKATLITMHKANSIISGYISDFVTKNNKLPSENALYKKKKKELFFKDIPIEIIYAPKNVMSFAGNEYNLLIINKKNGINTLFEPKK